MIGIISGAVSGLIGGIVLVVLLRVLYKFHFVKEQLVNDIAQKLLGKDTPRWKIMFFGVANYLLFGLFFGGAYALLINYNIFTGAFWNALIIALIPWAALMIVFMPLLKKGMFGLRESIGVPVMTLAAHLVYAWIIWKLAPTLLTF